MRAMLVGHLFSHFIFSKRAGSLVRRIAWLSVAGITVSVTAFLVVLFVMNGMNDSIKKRIVGLEPHLYLQVPSVQNVTLLETHPVIQRILETPGNQAAVFESMDVIIRTQDGQFRGGLARGMTQGSLERFIDQLQRMDRKAQGNQSSVYFWDPQDIPGEGEIVMGVDLAHSLGVFEGDFVTLVAPMGLLLPPGETPKFERVRIKKIVTTSLNDLDAQYLFYQRGKALKAFYDDASRKVGIEVWLADDRQVHQYQKDLQKFDGVVVDTWMDRNSALLYALKLEKLSIGSFLALAGMIAASSILTVLALLLSQKRRDIAILRTLGFSEEQTVKTFTQMGFILASIGVGTGVVLGTGISLYIQANPIKYFQSDIYYDSTIPALVDWTLVFGVLIVSGLIAWFGSYIPARTSAEVGPSEALRVK